MKLLTSLATCMGWGGVGWAINILSTLLTASRRSKTDSETNGDSETKIQKLRFRNYFHRFRNHHDSEPIAIQQLSLQYAETTTIHKLYHNSDTISRFRNYHDSETTTIQKPRYRNYRNSETIASQKLLRFRNYHESETIQLQKLRIR